MTAYLKSPADAGFAIGAQSGGNQPNGNDPKFIAMLDGCMASIEDILNTPLELAAYKDSFQLDGRFTRYSEVFRLHAGFAHAASVVVTCPDGNVLDSGKFTINAELGTVLVDGAYNGRWHIEYTAGFAADTSTPPIYVGTPSWLRSLVDPAAVIWFRSISISAKLPENVSFRSLLNPVYRDLTNRAYSRYQRPRVRVHMPFASNKVES